MSAIRDPEQDEAIRNGICYMGREKVFWQKGDKATGPGHIYSEAGLREYKMSGACEFHFDRAFDDLEPELPDDYNLRSYSDETFSPPFED